MPKNLTVTAEQRFGGAYRDLSCTELAKAPTPLNASRLQNIANGDGIALTIAIQ